MLRLSRVVVLKRKADLCGFKDSQDYTEKLCLKKNMVRLSKTVTLAVEGP